MEALGERGERVPLEPLLARLEDENEWVRRAAVEALGERGERVPLESLLARLEDEDADVRRVVLEALGKQGERVLLDFDHGTNRRRGRKRASSCYRGSL